MKKIYGRTESWHTRQILTKSALIENTFLRARTASGFEYLISPVAEHSDAEILRESNYLFSKIDTKKRKTKLSQRFKIGKISEHSFSNFPENWRYE